MITDILNEISNRFGQLEREINTNPEGHKWSTHAELVNFGKLKDKFGELRRQLGNQEKPKPTHMIEMGMFGATLTGREYGQECFDRVLDKGRATIQLDFGGVGSMSGPFAEEFVLPFAQMQGNEISVRHVTECVRSTLADLGIKINELP